MTSRSRRRWPWIVLLVVLLVLAGAATLAWWFPARWAWQWVRADYPDIHVAAVRGSVWDGRARDVRVDGQRLGDLRWTLSHRALFGDLRAHVALRGADTLLEGDLARTEDGAIMVHNARFRWPAARLVSASAPDLAPRGVLEGQVARLRLVDGWPTRLAADVTWRAAQWHEEGQDVELGTIQSHWRASGGSVIRADIHDAGDGPLRVRGQFLATALGWRFQAEARVRGMRPKLRRLLERIGEVQPDGSVRIAWHGGLAMAEPSP